MQAVRRAGPSPGVPNHLVPGDLMEALARGAVVLTANQRAARSLRLALDAVPGNPEDRQDPQAGDGRRETGEILPLQGWLQGLWHQLLVDGGDVRLLLNAIQEHRLWREIIAAEPELPTLRPVDSLAELAARAWHLLQLHGGSPEDPEFKSSTDTRAFARWTRQFAQVCSREHLLSRAELPLALETALRRGRLSLPAPALLLLDFDHHFPAYQALFTAIRVSGIAVEQAETSVPCISRSLATAAEPRDELQAAADWVRQQLERGPTRRIAVVVPDLARLKPTIERVFYERLTSAFPPTSASAAPLFEFSLGQPLAETGPGAAALDLLAWSLGALPLERVSHLLLSPFLTRPDEHQAVARFDAFHLRSASLLRPELSLDQTIALLSRAAVAPVLLQHLRAAKEEASPASLEQTHAAHAEHFRTFLAAAGWSHAVATDSIVAQMRHRWESALDELATLDFRPTTAQPTALAALQALTRIARKALFAPQSRDAPVQVLGPLELGGVAFDALWFLSAEDRSWPARAVPHPLLPERLQRRLGMPGASAADDDRRARAWTRRIAQAAPEVVFSYARRAEEADRQPSPLLRELALTDATPLLPSAEQAPSPYLRVPEAAVLPTLPDAILRGGERVLKDQAACAFRAFAEHRLWSSELSSRDPGLDPRDRGSLVHRILETFWAELQDQDTLRALPLEARHALLDQAIDAALERPGRQVRSAWDAAYLEVERERLRLLLQPWLELELERPWFRVQQQEQHLSGVALGAGLGAVRGGVRLELRVDRVDDTQAGPLILDYKTGSASPAEWLTDRPDAPQLPLYAVFNPEEKLGGVAFALLRAGNELGMKGFSDHASAVLAKPARMQRTLADQREEWFRVLTNLASAFAGGDTRVEPKSYPGTCQYCAQRLLCRLDPTRLTIAEQENEQDEVAANG